MSENPSQYGPVDPTQRFDPATQPAPPAPPAAPTSGQPGAASPYADPTQQMYSPGPGAQATPPADATPPTPEYGATPGYYAPGAATGGAPGQEAWGQQQPAQPGYPTESPGYPASGAPAGYPSSGGAAYGYQQSGYAQPGQPGQPGQYAQPGQYPQGPYPPQAGYPAPYQPQAMYDAQGRPLSDKSKLVAGLLGIFLGVFGVGRFYTGHIGLAVGQLLVSVFTCGIGSIWGLVDGIVILVNGGTDAQGRVLRD